MFAAHPARLDTATCFNQSRTHMNVQEKKDMLMTIQSPARTSSGALIEVDQPLLSAI